MILLVLRQLSARRKVGEINALEYDSKASSKERKRKDYFVPVTVTNRAKEDKSSRSNSRTKTLSVKKVNFIKN